MFVDREQELAALQGAYAENSSQFFFIYGKRRVGKDDGMTIHIEEAKRLIRETFQNHFAESRCRLFARNLFHDLVESKAFACQGQYIPDADEDKAKRPLRAVYFLA